MRDLRRSASESATLDSPDALISIKDLHVSFVTDEGPVKAVNGVDLEVRPGRTLGLVGESGCGKTVLVRSLMRILPEPKARIEGSAIFRTGPGQAIDLLSGRSDSPQLRSVRGQELSMIYQEPTAALSPVHTVGEQIAEALLVHRRTSRSKAKERAIELMRAVGIPDPEDRYHAYPFQLSGGLRQRAIIAMALICEPQLLIADEPTTALDVTVQAAILRLLKDLQAQMKMAILVITHDLGVISELADDIAVMYLGRIVEAGPARRVLDHPQHPYTQGLIRSVPELGSDRPFLDAIPGAVPGPWAHIPGCPFFDRCSEALSGVCDASVPELKRLDSPVDHRVRCFRRGPDAHE